MPDDTITLALGGDVRLDAFATAIGRLKNLLDALTREVASGARIDWVISALDVSSALTTVRGDVSKPEFLPRVYRVVSAYEEVGEALHAGQLPPFSEAVTVEALAITSVLDDHVDQVRFETALKEWIITSPVSVMETTPLSQPTFAPVAYGAVEGRVQTLTSRDTLRFTLYDTLNDRAVSCYMAEDAVETMRDVWGRVAVVEGMVTRDPSSGRPLSVRGIREVRVIPSGTPGGYRDAMGSVPRDGGPRAEDVIRLLRDA